MLIAGGRQCEVDCWDGKNEVPIVTHGNTFCSIELFEEVARGIQECAFVTSELPVVLSMEVTRCVSNKRRHGAAPVSRSSPARILSWIPPGWQMHCTPRQQNVLSRMMAQHFGDSLMRVRVLVSKPASAVCSQRTHHPSLSVSRPRGCNRHIALTF
jgi:hypothetical protein